MSGFVGILNSHGEPVQAALLRRITDAMAYCGPDRQDVWLDGQVGLGHALLGATPEPADGERQPCSLDGRVWIAGDVRVDGRSELVAKLGVPADLPDVHLVLHAYRAWGERCVEHLIGDFAFAIWDGAERRLFCARDHFGVAPLYYARGGDAIVIGNVLRPLRLHPAVSDALDGRAIGDYLLFGRSMDQSATTFADIRALPPAHVLTWGDGAVCVRRYWEPPEADREVRFERPEEHVERFAALFDEALSDRLRSGRVGAHLSGGMDSTSATASATKVLRARGGEFDVRAYTVVFEHFVAEEEGRYADKVAARLDIPVEHVVADGYSTGAPEGDATWVFPQPGVTTQNAQYEVTTRVSSFARQLIAGIGGDPLFYTRPTWPAGPEHWRDRTAFTWRALRAGRVPRLGVRTALRRRRRGGRPRIPPLPDWIRPDFARRMDLPARWEEVQTEWHAVPDRRIMLHPLWATIFSYAHPGAHGLPVRSLFPFFDLRVVQHVWTTPAYPWKQNKRLLREAMRGTLPDTVLERPKTPLYVPTGRVHSDDPGYRAALLPEIRRWREELIAGHAIGEYVDVERARILIESPVPRRTVPWFENCFALAEWLQSEFETPRAPDHRKDPHRVSNPATA